MTWRYVIMKDKDFEIIEDIVDRAEKNGLLKFNRISLLMDLDCVNNNIGLRLKNFLNADDFNFAHDIYGIQTNLNRETEELENFLLPRFAK